MFFEGNFTCFSLSKKEGIPLDKSLLRRIASGTKPSYSSNEFIFLNLSLSIMLGFETFTS